MEIPGKRTGTTHTNNANNIRVIKENLRHRRYHKGDQKPDNINQKKKKKATCENFLTQKKIHKIWDMARKPNLGIIRIEKC